MGTEKPCLPGGREEGLCKRTVMGPCGGGNVVYLDGTSVGTPAVTVRCSAANWRQWGKLGKGCMGCLCTVAYNCIWIYSGFNIENLILKNLAQVWSPGRGFKDKEGAREKERGRRRGVLPRKTRTTHVRDTPAPFFMRSRFLGQQHWGDVPPRNGGLFLSSSSPQEMRMKQGYWAAEQIYCVNRRA